MSRATGPEPATARVAESRTIADLDPRLSAYAAGSAMPWEPAKPGMWIKTLFASPDGRHRSLLFRLEPGVRSAPHAHDELEQIYVLEGDFEDGGRVLCAGDHCVRPPGVVHHAFSEHGALVLVVYSPA